MEVLDAIQVRQLRDIAEPLTWETQKQLTQVEDELAHNCSVLPAKEAGPHLLHLTSLPFSYEKPVWTLDNVWELPVRSKCETLVYRPTLPTGNMHAEYMVVGDAPGVGSGVLTDRFDRVLVYGPSSHTLRKALIDVGIYEKCWMTNLLKLSTPFNRPSSLEEVEDQWPLLERELNLVYPHAVIALGWHVSTMLSEMGIVSRKIFHPSYVARSKSQFSHNEYTDQIRRAIA